MKNTCTRVSRTVTIRSDRCLERGKNDHTHRRSEYAGDLVSNAGKRENAGELAGLIEDEIPRWGPSTTLR